MDSKIKNSYAGFIENKYLNLLKKEAKHEQRPLSFIVNRTLEEYYNEMYKGGYGR